MTYQVTYCIDKRQELIHENVSLLLNKIGRGEYMLILNQYTTCI